MHSLNSPYIKALSGWLKTGRSPRRILLFCQRKITRQYNIDEVLIIRIQLIRILAFNKVLVLMLTEVIMFYSAPFSKRMQQSLQGSIDAS